MRATRYSGSSLVVMPQRNRRTFWAAILTRTESDLREALVALGRTRLGFWLSFLVVGVFGFSLLVIWPFIGVPWWVGVCVGAALLLLVVSEAAFRTWRDLETALASPGGLHLTAGLGGAELHISPIPEANAYRLSFSRTNEEAREVRADVGRTPRAVRFESPESKQFLKAEDLPYEIKTRAGRRRHKIIVHRFIPGGVVIDDRDAPLLGGLVCTIHFDPSGDEGSERP
jgi:hypothetical protein